ncbi:MAG: VanZ family protein [Pseudomonadota bacterium]|nr:VanZ family protein [Pseudomonadota bacterium]
MPRRVFRVLFIAALAATSWQTLTPLPYEPLTFANDKLGHLLTFLLLALLVDHGWPGAAFLSRKALPLLAYGAAIELIQHFVPNRSLSFADWVADGAGILLYLLLVRTLYHPDPERSIS